jgi:hypothetical protein
VTNAEQVTEFLAKKGATQIAEGSTGVLLRTPRTRRNSGSKDDLLEYTEQRQRDYENEAWRD